MDGGDEIVSRAACCFVPLNCDLFPFIEIFQFYSIDSIMIIINVIVSLLFLTDGKSGCRFSFIFLFFLICST